MDHNNIIVRFVRKKPLEQRPSVIIALSVGILVFGHKKYTKLLNCVLITPSGYTNETPPILCGRLHVKNVKTRSIVRENIS